VVKVGSAIAAHRNSVPRLGRVRPRPFERRSVRHRMPKPSISASRVASTFLLRFQFHPEAHCRANNNFRGQRCRSKTKSTPPTIPVTHIRVGTGNPTAPMLLIGASEHQPWTRNGVGTDSKAMFSSEQISSMGMTGLIRSRTTWLKRQFFNRIDFGQVSVTIEPGAV